MTKQAGKKWICAAQWINNRQQQVCRIPQRDPHLGMLLTSLEVPAKHVFKNIMHRGKIIKILTSTLPQNYSWQPGRVPHHPAGTCSSFVSTFYIIDWAIACQVVCQCGSRHIRETLSVTWVNLVLCWLPRYPFLSFRIVVYLVDRKWSIILPQNFCSRSKN